MKRRQELKELRERSRPELEEELAKTRRQLFQNRIRFSTRALEQPGPLRTGKRRIARILTLLRQAELAAAGTTRGKRNGKRRR